jgi:ABC-type siderophore export system fused ATPase/permease subunit
MSGFPAGMIPASKKVFDVDWINLPFVWTVLILSIPFWYMVWLYLDSVIPSEFGINKHPCFCFMKSKDSRILPGEDDDDVEANLVNNDQLIYNENDPIKLNLLTKKFGSFTAVDALQFSIRKGEIFTLLGHNGAGKTTAINMLTGMLKATRGDAIIYGKRISD